MIHSNIIPVPTVYSTRFNPRFNKGVGIPISVTPGDKGISWTLPKLKKLSRQRIKYINTASKIPIMMILPKAYFFSTVRFRWGILPLLHRLRTEQQQ